MEDRFSVSWKDYVASSKEVVVMSFDGRGTGFRGDEIRHMVACFEMFCLIYKK